MQRRGNDAHEIGRPGPWRPWARRSSASGCPWARKWAFFGKAIFICLECIGIGMMARLRALGAEGRRRIIQVLAAVLYNANFGGFLKGEIYQGQGKKFCVPGLNCYSCPGAIAALPAGGTAGVAQQLPQGGAALHAGHTASLRRAAGPGDMRPFCALSGSSRNCCIKFPQRN